MTTQAERLARIETLVEGIAAAMNKAEAERLRVHTETREEIAKLREDFQADKAILDGNAAQVRAIIEQQVVFA